MAVVDIPDEYLELRSTLRRFVEREIAPVEQGFAQQIQEGDYSFIQDERARIRKRSAELGFWGIHMPEEVGGMDLPFLGQVLLAEEAARNGLVLTHAETILPVVSGPSRVHLDGTPEQRERYLAPLMTADKLTCFALTEPEAGSDATRISTKADRAERGWVLHGRKHFISAGDSADFALVFAVTDREKGARGGITAFLVDADTPGFSVTRVQRTMSPLHNPVELTLEGCEVPEGAVLGEVGAGFYSAMKGINGARFGIAATALGTAAHLLDRMTEYAGSRIAFGRPIGANQYVQGMVVDSYAELEQARLLVYKLASDVDDGADGRKEGALAKLVATEAVGRIADRAIQVHGGQGYMTELGLEIWYRDVRAMRLYEGTSEILRQNVAKTLGLPVL